MAFEQEGLALLLCTVSFLTIFVLPSSWVGFSCNRVLKDHNYLVDICYDALKKNQ